MQCCAKDGKNLYKGQGALRKVRMPACCAAELVFSRNEHICIVQVTEEALNESVPEESVVESVPLETSTSGSSRLNGAMAAAEAEGKPVRASMQRKLTEALQPQQ